MTEYTATLTLAVPTNLIPQANNLACLMGESSADINTFRQATYANGIVDYAVAHTVCKPVVTDALAAMTLPLDPDHVPPEYDRAQAEVAVAAIAVGDILVAVDVDPHKQFKSWGLEPIPAEENI